MQSQTYRLYVVEMIHIGVRAVGTRLGSRLLTTRYLTTKLPTAKLRDKLRTSVV